MKNLLLLLFSISLPHFLIAEHAAVPEIYKFNGFTENCGQITDTRGQLNSNVRYLWASPAGMNVQLRNEGLSFDVWQRQPDKSFLFHRLDMKFAGTKSQPVIAGVGEPLSLINDFRNGRETTAIPSYKEVVYKDIYPNIDFQVALNNTAHSFKYDFILNEGAEISDIILEYSGFDCFSIDGDALVFEVSGRTLREEIPLSWLSTNGQIINVHYKLLESNSQKVLIGFEAEQEKICGKAMVIDPLVMLEWSTYYGDSLYDSGNAVATDSLGNVFITGTTESIDAIASQDSHISEYAGGESDAFLVKFNQHGLRHWATYYGGSAADHGLGVAVDNYEHVYLVGSTASNDLLTENDTLFQINHGGGRDGFVAKFDRLGVLIWQTYLGGAGDDILTGIDVVKNKFLTVTGSTDSVAFDVDSVFVTGSHSGQTDVIMASFDVAGTIKRAAYYGGNNLETAFAIVLDKNGRIYISGATTSEAGIASNESLQTALHGTSDGFIAVFDSLFIPEWSTYFGGDGEDAITGIALDSAGAYIYFSGTTDTSFSYTDSLSSQIEFGGVTDGLVGKVSVMGELEWVTYAGGAEADRGISVDVDIDGSVYLLGHTYSEENIVFYNEDSVLTEYSGNGDAFVIKYNEEGIREWSYYYGGEGEDLPSGINIFGRTGIFFTGSTTTLDSLSVSNGLESTMHQEQYGGGLSDAFAARITGPKSTPPPAICCNCDSWGHGSSGGGAGGGGPQPIGICLGDSIRLSAAGGCLATGSEWVWYQDQCGVTDFYIDDGLVITVAPTETTTYFVRSEGIDEVSGCASVTVHVDMPIEVTAAQPDTVCPGTYLEFSASGAESYHWTGQGQFSEDGSSVIIDTVTTANLGQFIVTGNSQFGCSDRDTVEVNLYPAPQFEIFAVNPTCIGDTNGTITVSTTDSTIVSYLWSDAEVDTAFRDSLPDSAYFVLVTNSYGCSGGDSILLTEPEWPIDSLTTIADTCGRKTGSATLYLNTSPDVFTIIWSTMNADTNDLSANYLTSGSYSVVLLDSNGCEYSNEFDITDYGQFAVNIPEDSIFLENITTASLQVFTNPEQENATYHWVPDTGLSCADCQFPVADPAESTWYTVYVTSVPGCSGNDSIFVERELPPPNSFIPTVFSPNQDGLNDEICVMGARILSLDFNIFNRWGEKIFSTTATDKCWDGTYKGQPVTGVVMYSFEATLEEGEAVRETGNINILR